MKDYNKTLLIKALDRLTIIRSKIDRVDVSFSDLRIAGDAYQDALLDIKCQAIIKRNIKEKKCIK